MSYYYQNRKKNKSVKSSLSGLLLMAGALLILAAVLAPSHLGSFGRNLHELFWKFGGVSSILIPVYMGWLSVHSLRQENKSRKLLDLFLFLLLTVFGACLLSLMSGPLETGPGWGGWLGDKGATILILQFGKLLALFLSAAVLFVTGSYVLGLSPLSLLAGLKDKLAEDIKDWRMERIKLEERERERARARIAQKEPPARESPAPVSPAIQESGREVSNGKKTKAPPMVKKETPAPRKESSAQTPASSQAPLSSAVYNGYQLPSTDLLKAPPKAAGGEINKDELYANASLLEKTLEQFNVKAKVVDIHPGPVITRYDLSPAPGIRVQSIETLSDDIALAMKAQSIRVLAPVPGKAAVGIEISNSHPAPVYLRDVVLSSLYQDRSCAIPYAMGKTTEGDAFVADLTAMPHLLIAGTTGSGKSVSIHSLILSILFRFRPDELKLLLIDPKRLELPVYDGLPHLYNPASRPQDVKVITEPRKEVVPALKALITVMEDRYVAFAKMGVRNIEGYNEKALQQKMERAPYVIVIIDELADLMVLVGKEIEDMIQRLAQMARAVGIHLVLATQRPSVDVITGVIKANLPSRIAFQVSSKTDSRVVLDYQGAENLLGKGDMLYLASGAPRPARLQGSFVPESDVNAAVQFIKSQGFKPSYEFNRPGGSGKSMVDNEENRELLTLAAGVVLERKMVSGDLLREIDGIGSKYALALSLLKEKGLIEKPEGSNRWKIHFDRLSEFLASDPASGSADDKPS